MALSQAEHQGGRMEVLCISQCLKQSTDELTPESLYRSNLEQT